MDALEIYSDVIVVTVQRFSRVICSSLTVSKADMRHSALTQIVLLDC